VKPECTDYKFADVERQLTKGALNHGGNLCKYLKHLMLPKGNVLTEERARARPSRDVLAPDCPARDPRLGRARTPVFHKLSSL
jgi:hypothetical protein